jgi:hypothetical protein
MVVPKADCYLRGEELGYGNQYRTQFRGTPLHAVLFGPNALNPASFFLFLSDWSEDLTEGQEIAYELLHAYWVA